MPKYTVQVMNPEGQLAQFAVEAKNRAEAVKLAEKRMRGTCVSAKAQMYMSGGGLKGHR